MKKILAIITLLAICMSFLSGCSNSVDNSLTINNKAESDIYVNFRGSLRLVPAGKELKITDITRGTYTYETTFKVPLGTTNAKTEGAVSGQVSLKAGTTVLIVYSSISSDGTYTLSATISSSDDIFGDGGDNPILP